MKKGFTLVELLAVLVILGIILTITYYSVSSILDNSESSLSETQKSAIVEAAKIYYLEEGMNIETDSTANYSGKICVTVKYLKDNGYIDRSEVANPESPESNLDGYVLIENSKVDNEYTDKYSYDYNSGTPSGCVIVDVPSTP